MFFDAAICRSFQRDCREDQRVRRAEYDQTCQWLDDRATTGLTDLPDRLWIVPMLISFHAYPPFLILITSYTDCVHISSMQENQRQLNNALCYFFNPLGWKKSPFFRICKAINNNRCKTCESILQKQIVRFSFAYHKRAYYFCYLSIYSLMFYHILA